MVYFLRNPIGYKLLLTWQQADVIFQKTIAFGKTLHPIRDARLIEQMDSSARSVKRNIEEGYKRTTTKEYITFLGYSLGSLAELRGDYEDCLKQKRIDAASYAEFEKLLRGEDIMLGRQIKSLEAKMDEMITRSPNERALLNLQDQARNEKKWSEFWNTHFIRLPDGRVEERKKIKG